MITQRRRAAKVVICVMGLFCGGIKAGFGDGGQVPQIVQNQYVDKDHLNIVISVPLERYEQGKDKKKDKKDGQEKQTFDTGIDDQSISEKIGGEKGDFLSAVSGMIQQDSEYKKIVKRTGSLMYRTSQVMGALILGGNIWFANRWNQTLQEQRRTQTSSSPERNQTDLWILATRLALCVSIPSALTLLNNAFNDTNN